MEQAPKERNRIAKENKYRDEQGVNTLKAEKAGDYVPSLNKISKQTNPQ